MSESSSVLEAANDILSQRGVYSVWGFTSVVYERGDVLSFLLGILSLAPVALIIVSMVVAIVLRVVSQKHTHHGVTLTTGRTPTTTVAASPAVEVMDSLLGGMLVNFVISYVLKKLIRQPRPEHPWEQARRRDHGMPSNHSQMMFHYCVATAFIINRSWSAAGVDTRHRCLKVVQSCLLLLLAALVAWSRVYNHYHTLEQVLVGMVLGVGMAVFFEKGGRSAMRRFSAVFIAPTMNLLGWCCAM